VIRSCPARPYSPYRPGYRRRHLIPVSSKEASGRPVHGTTVAGMLSGRSATAIPPQPLTHPLPSGRPSPGGCIPAGSHDRGGSPNGSLSGSQRPQSPSHTQPRNTCSDGTSSHVRHHPATLRLRLILKQVHRESVLDIADPRHGRHPRCRRGRRRDHRGTWRPEPTMSTILFLPGCPLACARPGPSASRGGQRPGGR